jgi:feruloyl-CoA synthase
VSYAEARARVGRLAQGLLDRGLTSQDTIVIVEENSIAHALTALAAMHVGVAVCTLAPDWVRSAHDAPRVARVFDMLRPALIAGEHVSGAVPLRDLATPPETATVGERLAAVGRATVARYLLTSGSTSAPKLVTTTHGMLTANQQQIAQAWPFVTSGPLVLLDWLPWSHTFGASHNLHLALANGGTYWIDDGRPTAARLGRTIANLQRVRPTLYFSVPRGFDALLPHLERDAALAHAVLARLDGFFCAAAALSPATHARYRALAARHGRSELWFGAGWGSTETAPAATLVSWTDAPVECIGLPLPGERLRLVPVDDKFELRVRGPNITPGYLGADELTADAFDTDRFWRSGDAAVLIDAADPTRGLRLDGRLAEDFKLSSGTWVSVGPLREQALARLGEYVSEVIVCSPDRADVRLLCFPSDKGLLAGVATVQEHLDAALDAWRAEERGSSRVPVRGVVERRPLEASLGEVTAKGYVNQHVVRERRRDAVDALYNLATEA